MREGHGCPSLPYLYHWVRQRGGLFNSAAPFTFNAAIDSRLCRSQAPRCVDRTARPMHASRDATRGIMHSGRFSTIIHSRRQP